MRGRHISLTIVLVAVLGSPACKPPPTDAAVARAEILPATKGPSTPIASPDTTDAIWAESIPGQDRPLRLVYGVPGEPVLLALECLEPGAPDARLRITRHAPADSGAGALLALIGREAIGRFPVDATQAGGRIFWQGEAPALAEGWEALSGPRESTATIPGAGIVRLNPSPLPMALVETCRGAPTKPEPPVLEPVTPPDVMLSATP